MNGIAGKDERIIVTDFKNPDPKAYNYEQSTKYFNMLFEYMMATQGTFDGLIIVMNSKGLNWRHVYKTPINKMKKMLALVQVRLAATFTTIPNEWYFLSIYSDVLYVLLLNVSNVRQMKMICLFYLTTCLKNSIWDWSIYVT